MREASYNYMTWNINYLVNLVFRLNDSNIEQNYKTYLKGDDPCT